MELQWKDEWTTPTITGVVGLILGIGIGYGIKKIQVDRARTKNIERHLRNRKTTTEADRESEGSVTDDGALPIDVEHPGEIEGNRPSWIDNEPEGGWVEGPFMIDGSRTIVPAGSVEESRINHPSNVFNHDVTPWDWNEEVANREGKEIYIVHKDEYDGEEAVGYTHSTVEYYQGDDILTDTDDSVVFDYPTHIGTDNLKFGHGSCDPSIVFIRNDKLMTEYEVILNTGSYHLEVLGEEIENSLSAEKPVVPKFRPSD